MLPGNIVSVDVKKQLEGVEDPTLRKLLATSPPTYYQVEKVLSDPRCPPGIQAPILIKLAGSPVLWAPDLLLH